MEIWEVFQLTLCVSLKRFNVLCEFAKITSGQNSPITIDYCINSWGEVEFALLSFNFMMNKIKMIGNAVLFLCRLKNYT